MNELDDRTLTEVASDLATARNLLSGVHMTTPPQLIIARGRRQRHRSRVAAAAAAAGLGLAAGAALWLAPAATPPPAPVTAARHGQVHIQTAAWTVTRDRGGIVTLTIWQASSPDSLRRALARAGVPALVLFRPACDVPATLPESSAVFPGTGHSAAGTWLRIRPSAMPAGTEILIGFYAPNDLVMGPHVSFVLLARDSSARLAAPVNGHCPH